MMKKSYVAARFRHASSVLSLDADAVRSCTDLIDLSIGDTDFITDERIIDAAMLGAKQGATKYGFPKGDPALHAAIRMAWQEDFAQSVAEDELLVTASSCMGMSLALFATLDPGDEVIVFGPYFGVYQDQIQLAGGRLRELITLEEDGYTIREDRLRAAINGKTKGIILNNPCNPTGAAYDLAQLQLVADIAKEYDLLIYADEIYTRYLFEGEFIPLRTLPGMAECTITLNSFSKNFMMTGWRIGYAIAPAEIIEAMNTVNGGLIYTAPSVSQKAAIKALSLRDEIQQTYISQYRERVLRTADLLAEVPYLTLLRPKGTFYLFPGIARTGLSERDFCDKVLKEAHVLVSPGTAFGEAGKEHIRIAATQPMEKLEEAVARLKKLTF